MDKGCAGCAVFLLVVVVVLIAVYQVRTVRDGVSTAWRYTKCHVKLCDDRGYCPVWVSEDSRCEMASRYVDSLYTEYKKDPKRRYNPFDRW